MSLTPGIPGVTRRGQGVPPHSHQGSSEGGQLDTDALNRGRLLKDRQHEETAYLDTVQEWDALQVFLGDSGSATPALAMIDTSTGALLTKAIQEQPPIDGINGLRDHYRQDATGVIPLALGIPGTSMLDLTGQSGDIATTNLFATVNAGVYLIVYVLEATTADALAGTVSVTFGWTDDVGATTKASTALALTATGRTIDPPIQLFAASGSNVTYATSHTGLIGNGRYALRARLVALR